MQVIHRPGRKGDRGDRPIDAIEHADVAHPRGRPQGAGGTPGSRRHARDRAGAAVVVGSLLTMAGLIGGILANAMNGSGGVDGSAGLFVVGSGSLPWSAILLAGVVVTAAGAIAWAARLSSDYGALLGTALVLVLAFTLILGGWAGVRRSERNAASASAAARSPVSSGGAGTRAGAGGPGSSAIHNHTITDLGAAGSDVTGAIAGEGAEGGAQFGGHSHGQLGPTTDQEARATVAMLDAARHATARFRDIQVAKAAGYRQVTQFIPTLGLHMVNLKLMYGGRFDPVHPPILLYQPTPSGGLELVGVAYSMPQRGPSPPVGFPGGDDVWHYHTNLCFLPGGDVTVAPSGAACRANRGVFQAKTAWLLHAWIWKTNPNGVFTEANPEVF